MSPRNLKDSAYILFRLLASFFLLRWALPLCGRGQKGSEFSWLGERGEVTGLRVFFSLESA